MSTIEPTVEPTPDATPAAPPAPRRRRRSQPAPAPRRADAWSWRERWVVIVLAPVLLFLGWRVFSLGLADLWAQSNPDAALKWRPAHPQALAAAANAAVLTKDYQQADALARRTIASYPLDGSGYRTIGVGKDFLGDPAQAQRLFEIAQRRSPRDLVARTMLLQYAIKAGDFPAALHQIDVELRIRPDMAPVLMPRLVAASSIPAMVPLIDRLLAQHPPWRLAYLQLLASSGADRDAVDRVFAGRGGDDPLPPPSTQTEADLLIARQIADGRWGQAYFTWVSTLTQAQRTRLGNVFDGDFDFPPTSSGFDWRIPQNGTGFDMRVGPSEDMTTDNALQVHFDGLPLDYRPVQQLLILGPGHYVLSGMAGVSGIDTEEGGLTWAVVCASDSGQALGATGFFSGDMPLSPFQMEFDVPDSGCAAQWLRLDFGGGMFKGQALHGSAVFDHISIERATAGATANGAASAASPATGNAPVASDGSDSASPMP